MSPTVFTEGPYRFYFFSREEPRMHVHVTSGDGEAKFWLEPIVSLASSQGYSKRQLRDLHRLVERHQNEISSAWEKHFGS